MHAGGDSGVGRSRQPASNLWIFNVEAGLVLAISCLGLGVVVGWTREISLMQAGLTGSAMYITGYYFRGPSPGAGHTSFPLAAAYGIAFAGAVSLLVALVPARLAGNYLTVLTLSVQYMLENTVMLAEKLTGCLCEVTRGRPEFFGATLWSERRFYYVLLAALIVSMVGLHRLRHSRFGRAMIMVGSDKEAAAVTGVSPWTYKVPAFVIAGFYAGLAGALSAPLYMSPPGTLMYISFNSLFYLSIPILAGIESVTAVVGVAVAFTVIPQLVLDWKINVFLLGGLGLSAGVFLGPRGLGGAITDLFDHRQRDATPRAAKARRR